MSRSIGIVGLGLIGGSIAALIKTLQPHCRVFGVSRRQETVDLALEKGWIDEGGTAISDLGNDLDLVLVCTPISLIRETVEAVSNAVDNDSLIISDVGSVKGVFEKTPFNLKPGHLFIGGHPMAGTEEQGLEAADSSIVQGARYILCPGAQSTEDGVTVLTGFLRDLGFQLKVMDAGSHDLWMGFVSHIPYLMAVMTVGAAEGNVDELKALAGPGFRDTSRVASSSVDWAVDICETNRESLLLGLDRVEGLLADIRAAIAAQDSERCRELFTQIKSLRDSIY